MLPTEPGRQTDTGAILNALRDIHSRFGCLPEAEVRRAASELRVPLSQLYRAATPKSGFKRCEPHQIEVCVGQDCYAKGATVLLRYLTEELDIRPNETTEDGLFTLKRVRCVGFCEKAPVISVDDEVLGRLTLAVLDEILERHR